MSVIGSTATRYSTLSRSEPTEAPDASREKEFAFHSLPLGIRIIQKYWGRRLSYDFHKYWALLITFFLYACYHASRRPLNVVKPILSPYKEVQVSVENCAADGIESDDEFSSTEGWAPFVGADGNKLLVGLDLTFLLSYALGIIIVGRIADRSNLRHYLLCGMLCSGTVVFLFGLGQYWGIHSYSYYWILQATGWPAVVAIVAQWFGKENRGLIMGLWTSHASVGNSIGSVLSASVIRYGWGAAFLLLGSIMAATGALFWFFLVPQPSDAGFNSVTNPNSIEEGRTKNGSPVEVKDEKKSIGLMAALSIPGVVSFSIALFFSKLVAYTFLFWLPYYVASICIGGRQLSAEEAGDFSILFDFGGIAGGAFAGILYDMTGSGAGVSIGYSLASIPFLLMYNHLGRHSIPLNMCLLVICGFCVTGPFALITTAVSATLGTHESIAGNERALSTVAAIIDGMGSIGAAVGPTLTGRILESSIEGGGSFDRVFLMLSFSSLFCCLTLSRTLYLEVRKKTPKPSTEIEMDRLFGEQ